MVRPMGFVNIPSTIPDGKWTGAKKINSGVPIFIGGCVLMRFCRAAPAGIVVAAAFAACRFWQRLSQCLASIFFRPATAFFHRWQEFCGWPRKWAGAAQIFLGVKQHLPQPILAIGILYGYRCWAIALRCRSRVGIFAFPFPFSPFLRLRRLW